MSTLFKTISTVLLSLLTKYFGEFLSTIKELLKYLNNKNEDKKKKEYKEFEKNVDKVVDKGSMEDLLNLRK